MLPGPFLPYTPHPLFVFMLCFPNSPHVHPCRGTKSPEHNHYTLITPLSSQSFQPLCPYDDVFLLLFPCKGNGPMKPGGALTAPELQLKAPGLSSWDSPAASLQGPSTPVAIRAACCPPSIKPPAAITSSKRVAEGNAGGACWWVT